MPVEQAPGADRRSVTHLEALGRLVAGIAPWIELPADESHQRVGFEAAMRSSLETRLAEPSIPRHQTF